MDTKRQYAGAVGFLILPWTPLRVMAGDRGARQSSLWALAAEEHLGAAVRAGTE